MSEQIETVKEHCRHKDCKFRGSASGTPCCDYAIRRHQLRGCRISECTRYEKGDRKRWQQISLK